MNTAEFLEDTMSDRPDYGDAEVRQIMARAAEIERDQGHRLDARALREIGSEAGISPAAIERAIAEHESPVPVKQSWLKRRQGALLGAVITVVLLLLYTLLRSG